VIEAQQRWSASAPIDGVRVVTKRPPTAAEWDALRFAWRVCAHVKSNAVHLHRRAADARDRRWPDEAASTPSTSRS